MSFKKWTVLLSVVLVLGYCTSEKDATLSTSTDTNLMADHQEAERWANETLTSLSLEKKIGQMICEQMRGEYVAENDPKFQYLLKLVKEYGVGSFVLYGGTPHDTARILNRLQKESELPLLITSDFEGGPGQQILGATEFPANMALSAIGSEEIAYELGKVGASEGRAIGIHVTYSPVVDIQTDPDNPVLSVRSFGRDLELLGQMAGAYIKGYQENGMLATAKHYPGRGDVELIPGTEFTINKKTAEQVEAEDFLAFQKTIDAGVTYVMSEHIAVPSVTEGSDLPASVEEKLATFWLREKLRFEGILTTDDLWYKKVTDRFGPVKVCILAVKAGHDAILKPANVVETIQGLVDAVNTGEITEERIDKSVKKILYWKARLNLHRNRYVDESRIASVVSVPDHLRLAQKIADLSITVLKNDGLFPLDPKQGKKVVNLSFQKRDVDPAPGVVSAKLAQAFGEVENYYFRNDTSDEVYKKALQTAADADIVIISLFNQRNVYRDYGPLPDEVLAFFHRICAIKPGSTVVMSYGNPYLVEDLKKATAFVVGYGEAGFYGNQTIYADSFVKLLNGEILPKGKLPVKVSDNFPMGSGIVN
jgi:beta-N-acetylhexosaminidase